MSGTSDEDWFGSSPAWEDSGRPAAIDAEASHPFGVQARYETGPLLGQGGMGRVTAAHDRRLNRTVALKQPAPAAEQRLAQEAWIAANLEHPGIVPLYDAGRREDGGLYYTMRMVRGESLERLLASRSDRLSLLRNLRDACEAMGYAHAQSIIHRDLKPANLMIGSFGETQIVDWGLARDLRRDDTQRPRAAVPEGHGATTLYGAVVGTPAYMAPEQARGEACDARSDVFALGAMLYEILSGQPPYGRGSSDELLAVARRGEVSALPEGAPPALFAIAQRALDPDPDRRYPEGQALAEDITAWMDGRRVLAHDYSRGELLRRFARRNAVALGVAGLALVALASVGALSYQRTVAERDRARAEKARADRHLGGALLQQATAAAAAGARPEAEVLAAHSLRLLGASARARGILSRFESSPRAALVAVTERPECTHARLSQRGDRLLCLSPEGTSLHALPSGETLWRIAETGLDGAVLADRVAIQRGETAVSLYALADGALLGSRRILQPGPRFKGPREGGFVVREHYYGFDLIDGAPGRVRICDLTSAVAFDASGEAFVAACGDGRVAIGSSRTGPTTWLEPFEIEAQGERMSRPRVQPVPRAHTGMPSEVVMLGRGRAAVGTWRGEVTTVDLESGARLAQITLGEAVRGLQASPSGRVIAIRTAGAGLRLWAPATGALLRLPRETRGEARFRSERSLITLGRSVREWRLPEDWAPARFNAGGGLGSVDWSPEGELLVAGSGSGEVHLWRAATGASLPLESPWKAVIKDVSFAPDGRTIHATALERPGYARYTAPAWRLEHATAMTRLGSRRVVALRGGRLVAAGLVFASWGTASDLFQGNWAGDMKPPDATPVDLSREVGAESAVLAYSDGSVHRLDGESSARVAQVSGATAVAGAGEVLFVGRRDGVVRVAPAGRSEWLVPGRLIDLAVSNDGAMLAVGSLDGHLRLYDAKTGGLLLQAQAHRERIAKIAFDPDGEGLVTASWDASVQRWGLAALNADPEALVRRHEAAWGLSLESFLAP